MKRTVIAYIAPEFPKERHGFEAAELRLLATAYDVTVISLRRPSDGGTAWLERGGEIPVRLTRVRVADVCGGLLFAFRRHPRSVGATFVQYARLCRHDARGAAKAVVAGLLGLGAARIASSVQASWIHADFASAPASAGLVAARALEVPWSFTARAFDIFSDAPAGRATRPLLAYKLREARVVFAENTKAKATLEDIGAEYAVPVDCWLRRNGARLREAEARPPSGAFTVVGLGALVEKKGFDTLVRAVSRVRVRTDVILEIHGEGPERARLEVLADELDVPLRLPGIYFPDELGGILARASVVVVPSRELANGDSDGVPTVLIEALAHGRPVVGARAGAVTDLVRHAQTGLLVEPDSPEALADALEALAADPELGERLAARGAQLVRREFSDETAFRVFQQAVLPELVR
jgi:glycosyltransferase involved in cell wall biosynthesis